MLSSQGPVRDTPTPGRCRGQVGGADFSPRFPKLGSDPQESVLGWRCFGY